MPSLPVRVVVVLEPPVASSMVVPQCPHDVAVVIHIDGIRLSNRGHCVHTVLQRVVHIPARNDTANQSVCIHSLLSMHSMPSNCDPEEHEGKILASDLCI